MAKKNNFWFRFLAGDTLNEADAARALLNVLADFSAGSYDKKQILDDIKDRFLNVMLHINDEEILTAFDLISVRSDYSPLDELHVFSSLFDEAEFCIMVELRIYYDLLKQKKFVAVEKEFWHLSESEKNVQTVKFLSTFSLHEDYEFYRQCLALCGKCVVENYLENFYLVMYHLSYYSEHRGIPHRDLKKIFEDELKLKACQETAVRVVNGYIKSGHFQRAFDTADLFKIAKIKKGLFNRVKKAAAEAKKYKKEMYF